MFTNFITLISPTTHTGNAMSEGNNRKEALIRISQFIARKESEKPAKNCQMGLVKTILFSCDNKGLNVNEIVEEIDKQMGLKNFPSYIIEKIIESPEGKNEIYEKSGKYFLETDSYEHIQKIISERQNAIENFENIIKKKVKEKTKSTETDSKILEATIKSVYEFLGSWFGRESNIIANSLKTKKQISLPTFPEGLLSSILRKIKDKNDRQIVSDVIDEIFKEISPETGRLLYEILQNYLSLELLNVDPECRYLQKIAFSNKTLILDTNVLMALFLEDEPAFQGINETISIAKDLGVKLIMTKRTEQEWLYSLENSNAKYNAVNSQRPSLLPSLDDVFIRSFFKRKINEASLTWQGYYLQMRQIKPLGYEKGISYWYKKEVDSVDKLPNKEFFDPLSGRVFVCANRKGYPKARPVCEHDAFHILLVRQLREDQASDILGPSCWFLTLDTTLHCADEGLNEFMDAPFDPPSTFMADMWVSVISPFLGPEISEKRLADAFAHLMSTRFATLPTGLSAEMVIETLGDWLPFKQLSNKNIELILSDALVIKYYNQLKEARVKDPRRVEELAAKIRQRVDEKVFEVYDQRVFDAEAKRKEAELEKEKVQEANLAKDKLLAQEAKQRKLVLNVCLVLGIIFAIIGLLFLALINLSAGVALVVSGISFLLLSLGFRHFKFKSGPIELEATG